LGTLDYLANTNLSLEVATVLGAVESVRAGQQRLGAGKRPPEQLTLCLGFDLQLEKHRRASRCIE
jgi:hypothetical protein